MKIVDLAEAIIPGCTKRNIGIRPGEKLHEVMISKDDSRNLYEYEERYIKLPDFPFWSKEQAPKDFKPVKEGFEYSSDTNTQWLNVEELRALLNQEGVIE